MDKVRLEGDTCHPHAHGRSEPAPIRHPQRAQHVEAAHLARAAQRLRQLHVPGEHGSDATSGKHNALNERTGNPSTASSLSTGLVCKIQCLK